MTILSSNRIKVDGMPTYQTSIQLLMFSANALLIGALLLFQLPVEGQKVYRHSKLITGLQIDTMGRVLVKDSDSQYYRLIDGQLKSTKSESPILTTSKYAIWEGQLREDLGDGFHLYPSNTQLYDVVTTDDGYQLLAGESGLLILKQGQFKAYHIPGITFPRQLIQLVLSGDKLAMKTRVGRLFVYDLKEQSLVSVADNVDYLVWDKWNTLWFAQGRTLSYEVGHINALPPMLELSGVHSVTGRQLTAPLSLEVGSDLLIDYTVLYTPMLDAPKLVYRLHSEVKWQKVSGGSPLKLSKLPAGNYEIQLRAEGIGEVTAFSEVLSVKVGNDWLSKFWPGIIGLLVGLLVLALLSLVRLRAQMRQLRQEKDKIILNAELKSKTQKIGQLQMNPHFLFNTLNSISGLIALNKNAKARKYLNQFSQMMRKILDGSRKDFLTLSEEKAFLQQYLSLEAMCRSDAFSYEILIEDDMDLQEKVPAMILQPLVENAIIHGVAHKDSKGHISIHFQKSGKQIRAIVQDNGIGRTAAQNFRSETDRHSSAAMSIIQERLASLNKWRQSSIVYTDLYGEDGVASGTRVEVVF